MSAVYTTVPSVQVLDFRDVCLLIRYDSLIYDSCSSDQCFAFDFLQQSPHDDNLAAQLILPPVGCIVDFHHQVNAPCRAHIKKGIMHLHDPSMNKSRQRPTLPRSHPRSTIGEVERNFCVRYGNRCSLYSITTGNKILVIQIDAVDEVQKEIVL